MPELEATAPPIPFWCYRVSGGGRRGRAMGSASPTAGLQHPGEGVSPPCVGNVLPIDAFHGVTPYLMPRTRPLAHAPRLSTDLHPGAYLFVVFPVALLFHAAILAFCVLSPGAGRGLDQDQRQNSAAKKQSPLHCFLLQESHRAH